MNNNSNKSKFRHILKGLCISTLFLSLSCILALLIDDGGAGPWSNLMHAHHSSKIDLFDSILSNLTLIFSTSLACLFYSYKK